MKRTVAGVFTGLVVGSLVTTIGQGQAVSSIYVGGGPSFPIGEFGDYAKTGWLAAAGVSVAVGGRGLSIGGELMYGSNKHSDVAGDKTNLPGVFGFIQYRAGDPARPGVYFFGQAGVLNHQFKPATGSSDNDWKFAVGGGAGIDIPVGGASIFVEGRVIARSGTNFIPVLAGFAIPIG
jgi:hypothetical protein